MDAMQAETTPPDGAPEAGTGAGEADRTPADERSAAARRRLRALLDGTLAAVADQDAPGAGDHHSARSEADYLRDRPPHHGD
jgi:hypothetical protein